MEIDFSAVMDDIRRIAEREQRNAEELVEEMADAACKKVVQKSPVKLTEYGGKRKKRMPGSYKKGWKVEKELRYGSQLFVVKNDKEPSLTHILENGTDERETKAGEYRGSVRKRPHIRAAFDETVAEYDAKI